MAAEIQFSTHGGDAARRRRFLRFPQFHLGAGFAEIFCLFFPFLLVCLYREKRFFIATKTKNIFFSTNFLLFSRKIVSMAHFHESASFTSNTFN